MLIPVYQDDVVLFWVGLKTNEEEDISTINATLKECEGGYLEAAERLESMGFKVIYSTEGSKK